MYSDLVGNTLFVPGLNPIFCTILEILLIIASLLLLNGPDDVEAASLENHDCDIPS